MNQPEWVFLLGPGVALLVGILTIIGVLLGVRVALRTLAQKTLADARDQWWKRAQWAMDHVLSGDETKRVAGFAALQALVKSPIPSQDDLRILLEFVRSQRHQRGDQQLPPVPPTDQPEVRRDEDRP